MTDSVPQEARQKEPPARTGGFRLRFFCLIAAPAALLGLGGAYLLLSLAPDDAPLHARDFLPAYLTAAALAVALAAILAHAADFFLRQRLRGIQRTLEPGNRNTTSLSGAEREWPALRPLARAAKQAVERTDDHLQDAEELKALQRSADELLERIRVWAETEIAPGFEASGHLAELSGALATLARHLEERFQEAREVTELARQSLAETCERVERAGRESGRSAREIASLLTAAAEVKRLGGELSARLGEAIPPPAAAASAPRQWPVALDLGPVLAVAQERSAALGARLESLERLALRAALELAAEGISERREAGPWLDRVQTLRHVSLGARAVREESEAFAAELGRALSSVPVPAPVATAAAPAKPSPVVSGEIAAMVERLEQWGSDAHSRSERLAALAQRLSAEFADALGFARTSADELAGLAARFEARAASATGEEAHERAAQGAGASPWRAGARPLRLLTRDDVVPEDDENGSSEESSPRDA